MKLLRGLAWVVLVNVSCLAACGGTASRGRGGGGAGGVATGGSKTGTNDAGSSPKGGSGTGAAAATGGKASGPLPGIGGASGIQRCVGSDECPGYDEPCTECEDGSVRCNNSFCNGGACQRPGNLCPTACVENDDCPELNLPCIECKDGTPACPTNECVGGVCHTTYPACGAYEPCKDKVCGQSCTLCEPDEDCGVGTLIHCNDRGQCETGLAHCGTSSCDTVGDCGTPPPNCVACTNDTCAARDCVENQCVLACPPNTSRLCKDAVDCPIPPGPCTTCANGACAVPACVQKICELVCPL